MMIQCDCVQVPTHEALKEGTSKRVPFFIRSRSWTPFKSWLHKNSKHCKSVPEASAASTAVERSRGHFRILGEAPKTPSLNLTTDRIDTDIQIKKGCDQPHF